MRSLTRHKSPFWVVACSLAMAWPHPLFAQTQAKPAAPAQTKPAPSTAKPAAQGPAAQDEVTGVDPGWPRLYTTPTGTITIYQPQISSWEEQKHIVAWSAVSYEVKGAKPALGTIKIEAETKVSLDDRLVAFHDFTVPETHFSTLSRDQTKELVAGLQQAIPQGERVIELDRVLAAVDVSSIKPRNIEGVKADPPRIFSSTRPAILVNIDSDPVWNRLTDLDLAYAVNTNWDLFQVVTTKALYLRNESSWYTAADLNGPWSPAGKLPQSFSKLPADDNFKEVKANVPGRAVSASAMPTVFVSTTEAELLAFEGEPVPVAVAGTGLFWLRNTESDVFRMGKTGPIYYLVAGRWFSAPDLKGPWTFATPTLPEDFKKIPIEHERSRVRASVPGTEEANEAILLAQVPQTARVNRKEVKAPEVTYQGDPQFQPIEKTTLQRAVNTDKDIIKVGDLYYMCFQAVWFMSKSPTGPWEVATSVPKEIYSIPPSSAVYNVTYVTVEEDDDDNDDWTTFAYVAGYTGMMIAWGCVVWGSGWYYPPYMWYGPRYPVYYGYPRTYGFSAWYNPYTGAYGRGARVYGPYGGAGVGAVYNPRTGTYARGAAAYGPYGSRGVASAWNPRTGTVGHTRQGSNMYGNWGSTSVQRGDSWAKTGHVTNYRTGNTTAGGATSRGGEMVTHKGDAGRTTVGRSGSGDVYAGHDGNVYRKGSDGSWQSWNNGNWEGVNPQNRGTGERTGTGATGTRPTTGTAGTTGAGAGRTTTTSPTTSQLDRDSSARSTGTQRSTSQSTYKSSPSRSSAGSYRAGASRGGGGGRRR